MESRAKLLGHPIHQMLIPFPVGLFVMAVIFDIIAKFAGTSPILTQVSYYDILAGIVTGLIAAVFGFWDWLHIPANTRAKSIGRYHGLGNVVLVVLFAIAAILRSPVTDFAPGTLAFVIEILAVLLGGTTAWLGGELVDRLGVGVDQGANLNAPNSLSGKPAGRPESLP